MLLQQTEEPAITAVRLDLAATVVEPYEAQAAVGDILGIITVEGMLLYMHNLSILNKS